MKYPHGDFVSRGRGTYFHVGDPTIRLCTQLHIAGKEQTLAAVRAPRKDAYDGENGLKDKMLAIKEATKSQYGSQSPEFLQIKGIRV